MIDQQRQIRQTAAELERAKQAERPATMITFVPQTALQPFTATNTVFLAGLPKATVTPRRWRLTFYVATTNNGGNYWTITLATAAATLAVSGTPARAPNTWYTIDVDLSGLSLLTVTASQYLTIAVAKTGAPGALQLHPVVFVL